MARNAGFIRWALFILIPTMLLLTGAPPLLADAKTGEITLEDQAFINVIRKDRPDFADKLERRLKRAERRIKQRKLNEEQAKQEREAAFDEAKKDASKAFQLSQQVGSEEQQANALRVSHMIWHFHAWYIGDLTLLSFHGALDDQFLFEGAPLSTQSRQQLDEVKAEIKRLREERKLAEQEGSGAQSSLPPNGFLDGHAMTPVGLELGFGFGAGEVDLPRRSFLKTKFNDMITDLAFGERDPTVSLGSAHFSARHPLFERVFGHKRILFSAFGDASIGSADLWESFELNADGQQLGLYGVEGVMGPLGSGLITAEGFGDVTDGFHWLDYEEFTWRAGIAGGSIGFQSPVKLELSAAFLYGETSEDSAFGGVTNLGTVHFEYNTRMDSIRRGVQLGASLRYALFTPEIGAYATATGQFTSDSASGRITLTSDFNGDPFPTEMQHMSESRFNVGGTLGAGLYVDAGPFRGFAGAEFETFNVPGVHLTGEEPAEIDFERRDSLSFKLGFSVDMETIVYSDVRLKRDIARLATLENGLHLYRYRYLWSDTVFVGVMAQEVEAVVPAAVAHGPGGFLRVDYARLGLRPMTWQQWTDGALGDGL